MIFNMGGGGVGLNCRIIAATAEITADGRENDVQVYPCTAENEVKEWVIQVEEPDTPTEGLLWIYPYGDNAASMISLLKRYVVKVCPFRSKIYRSGAWVLLDTKVFVDGAWKVPRFYYYYRGDLRGYTWGASNDNWISQEAGDIRLTSGSGTPAGFCMKEQIDLTNVGKMHFVVNKSNGSGAIFGVNATYSTDNSADPTVKVEKTDSGDIDVAVDVSSRTDGYIKIRLRASGQVVKVYEIYGEGK